MAATATAEKKPTTPAPPADKPIPGTEIAIVAPPRLPYHPAVFEQFNVDRAAWKALVESVFPSAKTSGAVILALSYCKARRLDPFKRVVHIVPIWDSQKKAYIESVWPGIGEHRTTAMRTKKHAGLDAPAFGPVVKRKFTDKVTEYGQNNSRSVVEKTVEVEFPEWCQITVYRLVGNERVAFPGPRVLWMEFYSRSGKSILPNDRWQRAPWGMIEKCAEAGALRRAFPEELGDELTAEEDTIIAAMAARDITPQPPTPEPTRDQFRGKPTPTDVRDEATGGDDAGDDGAKTESPDQGDVDTGPEPLTTEDATLPEGGNIAFQVQGLVDLIKSANYAGDIATIDEANAGLLKKWRSGADGSQTRKAAAAYDEAKAARLAELAAE